MDEKQAGVTALVTAYARAYHATHDSPKIFDDFLADQFYTPEEHTDFDRNLAGLLQLIDPHLAAAHPDQAAALAQVMQTHNGPITLSRSRYAEDCLEEALRQGVQEYILLGAGFDTFAFRRPDLRDRLQIFEVDHPVTQALKRQRIALAGWEIPANLHFVPVDFNTQGIPAALLDSPYDRHQPAFISWLGVTYYLAQAVVFATLQAVAGIAQKGSQIVFDYMDADAFIPIKAGKRIQLMQMIAGMVGEPMKAGFDPAALAHDLHHLGLRLVADLGPAEIEARYFQGRADAYHAFEHVHFARAVVE
jgi:methyltransferase (TIGR00027 family)